MASLSRAPDQHQVPAQVLLSSRPPVAISSAGFSVWFPPSASLSLSARSSVRVLGARSAPSASAGASFYPSSLDVVSSSRSRPRVFRSGSRLRLRFRFQLARLCACVRRQISTKCQRRCFLSVRRDLVPGSRSGSRLRLRFRFQRARLCACVRRQISTKCQRGCFFLPPAPWTSSVRRDLVPGSRSGSRFCLRLRSQLGTARSSAGRRQLQGNRRHRVPTCQGHVQ
jgi:hypothetical protein